MRSARVLRLVYTVRVFFFFAQVLLSVEGTEVLIYNIALVTGRSV